MKILDPANKLFGTATAFCPYKRRMCNIRTKVGVVFIY
jgi:hypothetical protein